MKSNVDPNAVVRQLVPIYRLPPENQAALLDSSEFQPVFEGPSGQLCTLLGRRDGRISLE